MAASIVLVASVAWACHPVVNLTGDVIPSQSTVARGNTLSAAATDATASMSGFALYFNDPDDVGISLCHHATVISTTTVSSNANGDIPSLSGVIPLSAGTGAGQLCFGRPVSPMQNATNPVAVTIT